MRDQKLIPDITNMAKVAPMPKLGILRTLDNQKKGVVQGFEYGGNVQEALKSSPDVEPINPNSMFTEAGRTGGTSFTQAVPKNAISASDTVGGKPMKQSFEGKPVVPENVSYSNKYGDGNLSISQSLNSVEGSAVAKANQDTAKQNVFSQDTKGNVLKDGVAIPPKFPEASATGAPRMVETFQPFKGPTPLHKPETPAPVPTGLNTSDNSVVSQALSDKPEGNLLPISTSSREEAPDMSGAFTKKKPLGFAKGGILKAREKHPIGKTDTVPAMLTPGEFVVKKDAVDKVGEDFLKDLNDGKVQGYALEGINDGLVKPKFGDLPGAEDVKNRFTYPEAYSPGQENKTHGFKGDPKAPAYESAPLIESKAQEGIFKTRPSTVGKENIPVQDNVSVKASSKDFHMPVQQGKELVPAPGPKQDYTPTQDKVKISAEPKPQNFTLSTSGKELVPAGKNTLPATLQNIPTMEETARIKANLKDIGGAGVKAIQPKTFGERALGALKGEAGLLKSTAGNLIVPAAEGYSAYKDMPELDTAGKVARVSEAVGRGASSIAGAGLGTALGPLGTLAGGILGAYAPDIVAKTYKNVTGKDIGLPSETAQQSREAKQAANVAFEDKRQAELAKTQDQDRLANIEAQKEKDTDFGASLKKQNELNAANYAAAQKAGQVAKVTETDPNMKLWQEQVAKNTADKKAVEAYNAPGAEKAREEAAIRKGIFRNELMADKMLASPYAYGKESLDAAKDIKARAEKYREQDLTKQKLDTDVADRKAEREQKRADVEYERNTPEAKAKNFMAQNQIDIMEGKPEAVAKLKRLHKASSPYGSITAKEAGETFMTPEKIAKYFKDDPVLPNQEVQTSITALKKGQMDQLRNNLTEIATIKDQATKDKELAALKAGWEKTGVPYDYGVRLLGLPLSSDSLEGG